MQIVKLKFSELQPNTGQIPGLPINPRQWTKSDVDKIAASLKETPELFEARPLLVIPHDGKFVILGGNLRYEGARVNKMQEVPAIVFPEDTPVDKMKEVVIKDNGSFGAWDTDYLANEWDDLPLTDWGVPVWETEEEMELKATEELATMEFDSPYYEPTEVPGIKLRDCVDLTKYKAKMEALQGFDLTKEQREILEIFAYRFIKIDFEKVATYYAFNASDEEKKAIERLRMVLVDSGTVRGFIEDDLIRICTLTDEQLADVEG